VAQLERAPANADPYGRLRPDHPEAIQVEGDNNEWKSYEIEKLLDRRERKYGRKTITEYLVRWKGYGPEQDQWYGKDLLENAQELITQFENIHGTKANALRPRRTRA